MAELGARAEAATEEPVVGDDRAADARADREGDHVADEAARAVAELRPAGGVRVVLDDVGRSIRPRSFSRTGSLRQLMFGA
ncbi:hypothetical protein MAFF212519_06610 [Clavibacter michiganensis]